jgi:uncharacterized membrane protein YeaQ/YmgE (transglycosylase-associated protein family)
MGTSGRSKHDVLQRHWRGRAKAGDPWRDGKEDGMGIIGWLILGLGAGAIARLIHRGEEPGGLPGTLAVGVAGAVLGGLIASVAGIGGISSFFSLGTWVIAVAGAMVLLVIYSALMGGRRGSRPASS